jgi:hypothetical protein
MYVSFVKVNKLTSNWFIIVLERSNLFLFFQVEGIKEEGTLMLRNFYKVIWVN